MAVRVKFIDSRTTSSYSTTHNLNINGVDDPNFVVDRLVLRLSAVYSAWTSGTFTAAGFGSGLCSLYWRKTNNLAINNVTWRAIDLWQKRQRKPAAISYDVFTTQTPTTGATFNFDLPIPMKRKLGARPADFCVPLSEIGQMQVSLPADPITGTFTNLTMTLIAIGHDAKPGEYVAGSHWRLDELTGETGNNVTLDAGGNKVLDLFDYTIDPSGSPISDNTNPRVELDGREVVNFRDFNCSDTPWLWGLLEAADDYSDFRLVTGNVNTLVGDLLPAPFLAKISAAEQVRTIRLDFGARLTTATDDRFVLTTLYPSQSPAVLAQRVPGAGGISAEDMAAIAQKPGVSGPAASGSAFLPATIKV